MFIAPALEDPAGRSRGGRGASDPAGGRWRIHSNEPLPPPRDAWHEPFSAFPSWYLRITSDRCGKVRMINEVHTPHRDLPMREIARMRHDGCGGGAGPSC
jgi:hypothetical protein